jgi:MFS family permease
MDEYRLRYEGWRVVAGCSVATFFATVPLNTFPVFLKPVCDAFGWSRQATSSAFSTLTLVAALSAPCLGFLLDRVGARRIILRSLAASGLAVASLALLTSTLWHLRIVFGVLGLATMGASPIASSRAIFGWFDARRGRALGLMVAGAALSGIVTPPIAAALIRSQGWRTAWFAFGLSTLLIALPIVILYVRDREVSSSLAPAVVPGTPSSLPAPGALPSAHKSDARSSLARSGVSASIPASDISPPVSASGALVRTALRTRIFWTLILVVFGATLATSGALVHIVALLADRGVPQSSAALAVSALGGASLAGRLLTGWLLDRFDARRVSMTLLTIAAGGVFLLSSASSLSMGVLAAVCIGFGAGGEVDVTPFLLSRYFGLRSLATLYGFNWTAWGVAGAMGAVLLGREFDATGSYSRTLIEFGVATLTAVALTWTLPALPARVTIDAPTQPLA